MHFFRFLRDAPYFAHWAQYGLLAFPPFCATSASASPRGRRERTLVRPLALGLASLNSHQTDENASLGGALLALPIRAFEALFRSRSIRAFGRAMCSRALRAYARLLAPYWLCQYGLLHFRHFARLLRQRCHAGVGNELNSHQTDEDASLGGARIGFANTGALCLPQKQLKIVKRPSIT